MDTHTYPGKGLSISELVFALSEELKRVAYSPSFTLEDVSQLDRDLSPMLIDIREWRSSLTYINRMPLDILPLIFVHLPSQTDLFRASRVCRHWRRVLLQNAALWSWLFIQRGQVYVRTLLGRAQECPLDIFTDCQSSAGAVALLSPHTQRIRYLNFMRNYPMDIRSFSQVNSGPLPLLTTLEINILEEPLSMDLPDTMTPPFTPLFTNAVNLKRFILRSQWPQFLNHFAFPNLTTFELSILPPEIEFDASELLDFLEASPALQTVEMTITTSIQLTDVLRGRIVVLPKVETFSLVADDGWPGYELATCISCPSARQTSLMHRTNTGNMTADYDIFPTPDLWNAIAHRYTANPVEMVTLEMKTPWDFVDACSLAFRSTDMAVLRLGFELWEDEDELPMPLEDMILEVFSQACRIIGNHPLLSNIKRQVHILDELSLYDCDLNLYLTPFLGPPDPHDTERRTFPPTKELTVAHPSMIDDEECMSVIVKLAKSQHALGVPFERVTFRAEKLPKAMAEMLRPWVGVADCYEEWHVEADDE